MKLTRIIATCVISFTALFAFLMVPTVAQADDYGLGATASQAGLKGYGDSVPKLAGSIIGTALSMISVIFFILMVYGGFLWMTAHGDEGQVTKAQETIIGAVIGIIVILASYAITNFVTTSVVSNGNAGGGPAAQAGNTCAQDGAACREACSRRQDQQDCIISCNELEESCSDIAP